MPGRTLEHRGVRYAVASRTDTGLVREKNEDSVIAEPERGLFGVCDGMGGHAAGEVASSLACDALCDAVEGLCSEPVEGLRRAVRQANKRIFEAQARQPEYRGMGTTISALLLCPHKSWVVHVGDSRVYLMSSENGFKQLTSDHSPVYRLYQQGMLEKDQMRQHPQKNLLDRSLGVMPTVEPDVIGIPHRRGDLFLICSDGLTDELCDRELQEILEEEDLEKAADALVAQAKATGGRDNISLVLLRIEDADGKGAD